MSSRFPLFHRAPLLHGKCIVASPVSSEIKAVLHSSRLFSRLPCAKRGEGGLGELFLFVCVCVFFLLANLSFNGPNSGHWAPAAPYLLAPSGTRSQSTRAGRFVLAPWVGTYGYTRTKLGKKDQPLRCRRSQPMEFRKQ